MKALFLGLQRNRQELRLWPRRVLFKDEGRCLRETRGWHSGDKCGHWEGGVPRRPLNRLGLPLARSTAFVLREGSGLTTV